LLSILFWIAGPCWAGDSIEDRATLLTPDAAVAAALDVHPSLLAAELDLARARGAAAEAALLLSNPTLAAETTQDGARGGAELTLSVSLRGAGWAERSWTRAELAAAVAGHTRTRLATAAETRSLYAGASVAAGKVRVALEGLELATRLRHAVTRLQEEGEVSTLELRLARLAEVQAAAELLAAREAEAEALQLLAGAIGQAVRSEDLVLDPLAAAPEAGSKVAGTRSDVVAAADHLRAAEAELRLQRARSLPAVELGVFAEHEDDQTFWGPSVGLELPLFRHNQANRAHASAGIDRAEAALASVTARAHTELATAEQRVADAVALSSVLQADPITEARAALASIESGYLAGEIDLPSAVLLQAEVLDGETAALDLLGHIARARIDLLVASEDPMLLGGAS